MGEPVEIFLSYNRRDAADCQRLATGLQKRGLKPFKDDWYLTPGDHWPSVLERRLADCKAVAVLIGGNGLGPWQQREVYAAIDREVKDQGRSNFRVIPVVLKGGESHAGLGFLAQNVWVDADDPRAIDLIVGALDGKAPAELYDDGRPDPRTLICPYRGLGVFREEDQAFYFGREADVEKLVAAVRDYPLVAIVGASGSGKSSLARAGLFPRLRRQKGGRVWQILEMVPGSDPFVALARALLPLREPERYISWSENDIDDQVDRLADRLTQKGAPHFLHVIGQIRSREPGTTNLLLLVDQWEELYTHRPANAVPFIKKLLEVVRDPAVQVVLTVRADYWGEALSHYPPLGARLAGAATVHLSALQRIGLEAVIRKPAEQTLLTIEPALVEALLNDTEDQPGDLPLLEFALRQLWTGRSGNEGLLKKQAYVDMGRLKQAIVTHAKAAYRRLTQEERDAVPGVFTALVHVEEARADLRRRARLKELSPAGQAVARRFADERLLVTSRDWTSGDELVEVAHEALLRHWPKLQEWIEERRGALLTIRQLQADAKQWWQKEKNASYLWSNERVREAVAALRQVGADVVLTEEQKEFLGPIEPMSMKAELDVRDTSHARRLLIGQRLAIFGDDRYGVGLCDKARVPNIAWCPVRRGKVTINILEDANNHESRIIKKAHKIITDIEIARFPITVSQYRSFLYAPNGWRNSVWWQDDLYRDPDACNYSCGMFDNYPAIRVSWFDAVAFCRWLSDQLSEIIRLPDEWEWQQAASGGDQTKVYPWGQGWNIKDEYWFANTYESQLWQSTAVGMYPCGRAESDVFDMGGNVWEWCSNKFDAGSVTVTESTPNDLSIRVLRGGAWNGFEDGARVSRRYRHKPSFRTDYIGFRVVRSCQLPGH